MILLIQKFFDALLDPFIVVLFLLIVLSIVLYRHYRLTKYKKWALAFLVYVLLFGFFTMPFMVKGMTEFYCGNFHTLKKIPDDADCYILLGSGIYGEGGRFERIYPNRRGVFRILHVLHLYRKKPLKIILSGGKFGYAEVSEAEAMADLLVEWGVKREDLILEDQSRTTYENALYSAEKLKQLHLKKPVLVTDAVHMRRGYKCFQAFQINPYTSVPARLEGGEEGAKIWFYYLLPNSNVTTELSDLTHEIFALVYYGVSGKF